MKLFKYLAVGTVAIFVLVLAVLVVLPSLINVEKYKPEIEKFASERTGFPISLGGSVDLSFFPWAGLSFENLKIGNPQGFSSDTFVKIKRFKTGVKLMSLLVGDVEIDSFMVEQPEIFIERTKEGRWNWQPQEIKTKRSSGGKIETKPPAPSKDVKTNEAQRAGLPIKSFNVGAFTITAGRIQVLDRQTELKRELSDFSLVLSNISLDTPVAVESSWLLDGNGFALAGTVGPLGTAPGSDAVSYELQLSGMQMLEAKIQGKVANLFGKMSYTTEISVEPFNPREAAKKLNIGFPVKTNDPTAITRFGLNLAAEGFVDSVSSSTIAAMLDETTVNMEARVADFKGPDVSVTLGVDRINLDRYLPPSAKDGEQGHASAQAQEKNSTKEKTKAVPEGGNNDNPNKSVATHPTVPPEKKVDYSPLRTLVLAFNAEIGEMTVHGGKIDRLSLEIDGKNGLFLINKAVVELYEGRSETTGRISFQGDRPEMHLLNNTNEVLAGPLLSDFTGKAILEGAAFINADINCSGQEPAHIKRSLNGKGLVRFEDGAIVGIDLARMARQIESGFSLDEQGEKPKTDFAELAVPFMLNNGVFHTDKAMLQSPFLRVAASGRADLADETLDMRVKPKIVGTKTGQGDTKERSGLTVPVIVSGSFDSPVFTLDLKSVLKDEILDQNKVQKILDSEEIDEKTQKKIKEGAELLKNLLGN